MATLEHSLTDGGGWVEIAADATDFQLENRSTVPIKLTYQAAPPASDAPFHLVSSGESAVRVGTGIVYAATADGRDAFVIVTT